MFEFKVTHQKLVRTDSFFAVEKSRNYLAAHFEFLSDEWNENGTITAFFRGKGFNEPAIVGADGTCRIPNAAVQNDGRVYVHLRYIGGDGIEIPTNEVAIDLKRTGADDENSLPEPTPDVYAQIAAIAADAKAVAASVRADADNGEFDGEKGEPGTPGKDGLTPIKGSDYFTETEIKKIIATAAAQALPHITLAQADGIADGLYIVDDAFADWAVGTSENPLTSGLLLAGTEEYYGGSAKQQTLILPTGELWRRSGTGEWKSVIPDMTQYAKTSDLDAVRNDFVQNKKLKLIKTITLEEDVHRVDVEFDKPLDEVAILYNVAFNQDVTGAFITRTEYGGWFMFYRSNMSLKTTPRYFYAHAKEIAERQWETFLSGNFFEGLSGIANGTTAANINISKMGEHLSRYIERLQIYSLTEGVDVATGSVIEIWGHEADENL